MDTFGDTLAAYKAEIERRRADPEYRRVQQERFDKYASKFDCPTCFDTGRNGRGACQDCAELRRQMAREAQLRARTGFADLQGELPRMTFERFDSTRPGVRSAYEVAREYAAGQSSRRWLVLMSDGYGSGKTHLAAAIVNYRVNHPELGMAKWVEVSEFLRTMQSDWDEADSLELAAKEAPCLVLDDFGAEYHRRGRGSESWASIVLYRIVNYRYVRRLETVFTSNVAPERWPGRVRSRVLDTGTELSRILVLQAPDYRQG